MAEYEKISTKPVKGFFVEMLTRDLSLEDAILDLLDNCIDGITRSLGRKIPINKPYENYWAKITIENNKFEIEDNCGGIPWSEHDRAFRMGRPKISKSQEKSSLNTVGVYGIGMKRAIFKIGTNAKIWTYNSNDAYEVSISPEWMQNEDEWDLDVTGSEEKTREKGTCITIDNIYPNINDQFIAEKFVDSLIDKIENFYSIILEKGFNVSVNGENVLPRKLILRFDEEITKKENVIRPYMFSGNFEDVEIFVAVGLREPIPNAEILLSEQESVQYSSNDAGWTIICNDRIVLYCNKDELTGWGTAGIPRYHTQFRAISGIVEFTGNPAKLPTNTTKRGLDFSSKIYQQTLNRMRDGLRIFVDYTNKWKTKETEAREQLLSVKSVEYSEISKKIIDERMGFNEVKTGIPGQQYKPKLPLPPKSTKDIRISYVRDKQQIDLLAEQLINDIDDITDSQIPRKVGELSFDYAYKKLIKK